MRCASTVLSLTVAVVIASCGAFGDASNATGGGAPSPTSVPGEDASGSTPGVADGATAPEAGDNPDAGPADAGVGDAAPCKVQPVATATAGPLAAMTAGGGVLPEWQTPTSVFKSDAMTSDVILIGGSPDTSKSEDLIVSGFKFGIPVLPGASVAIKGITVDVVRRQMTVAGSVKSTKVGVNDQTIIHTGGWSLGSYDTDSFGGPSELWGATWTPALLDTMTVKVQVTSGATGTVDAAIDAVAVRVSYEVCAP